MAAEGTMSPPYTTKIIKAGALLEDTKALLAEWDQSSGVDDNFKLALAENWLGKGSRNRADHVLSAIEERYFTEPEVGQSLARLVQGGTGSGVVDNVLYLFTAQANPLLYDF